jgi:hypothetical protein
MSKVSGVAAAGFVASAVTLSAVGPWYSIIIAVVPLVVGLLSLPKTKDRDIRKRRSFRNRTRLGSSRDL